MSIHGYYYNKETLGFSPLLKPFLPADGFISIERHAELMADQEAGKRIVPDDKGNPIAVERPQPTTEQASKIARSRRDAELAKSDWTQLRDCPLDDQAMALWRTYRQALRDVPAQAGFPTDINWPELPE